MTNDKMTPESAGKLLRAAIDSTHPIEAVWKQYRARVMPRNASPIQEVECKLAFFAGANVLFDLITCPNLSEDQGLALLAKLRGEILTFGEKVSNGEDILSEPH